MVAKSRRKNRKLSKSGKTRQRRRYSQKRRRIYKKKGGKRGTQTEGKECTKNIFGMDNCAKGLKCTKGEDGSLKCQPKKKGKDETCTTKYGMDNCAKGLKCTKGEDGSLKCQPKTKKKKKGHCEPCRRKSIRSECKNELECINFKCQWKDRKKRKGDPCNKCIEIPQ